MKKTLFALIFALGTTSVFAQITYTASQVCQKISQVNAANGNVCAQLISRNMFEQGALNLAVRALETQGSAPAIEILKITANKRIDPASATLVEAVMKVNQANALVVLNMVLDRVPNSELFRLAHKFLASHGSSQVVTLLQNVSSDAYLFAPLLDICESMIAINAGNSLLCLQAIANKVSLNGSEQVCKTALANGSSYALTCIQGIVVDYTPIPQQPTTILVEELQIRDLQRSILKTRAQLERGNIDNARRTLNDAIQALEDILGNSRHPRR